MFRRFPRGKAPDCYYDHIRGNITREQLFSHPDARNEAAESLAEAKNAELGKTPPEEIDRWISEALNGEQDWVLIGGPPCQAYSMAGRSRRTREDIEKFESDEKHFLYKEYLRIIQRFKPAVFIMENVKGMLSSTHGGGRIFERIMADLSAPNEGLEYEIRSLVSPGDSTTLKPADFVIEAERFGVPQGRHRVILFGIRSDVARATPELSSDPSRFSLGAENLPVSVGEALSGLPALRSRLSKESDSHEAWLRAMRETPKLLTGIDPRAAEAVRLQMEAAALRAKSHETAGAPFITHDFSQSTLRPRLRRWFLDERLGGVIQHETRSHMRSDIHRYFFASAYAKAIRVSPKVTQFPPALLPAHGNVRSDNVPFADRFRVQLADYPSSTVVAHIAKDGHYFIHPDPAQCRSLTVREAARLQTFPDNYYFAGNKTQQYTQVGNAVPPWLARRIATVVADFMHAAGKRQSRP
ncbi:DNA (cytosine-5-)-methyltransferase [Crenobacter sp. SG2303]|uniref:DNA (cytosine-5-)-methyltransferase n=2 Tax=Crenobacter oryzisoli TaxID=3056844 RepID=A0ABT7XNZ5_9NEIS|nr:DNA (cytosine-5-)-methyltransferase [Crenobacter sp. SG2303]MDN0075491.1 DNA (cytosine-5-)-methyltransferase [Crenobacter sp. SG2303]